MRMLCHNRLFQAAVVAAGIVALGASDALAWGHKSSYGSYGSSSGSYASSSSYGSYGSSSSSSYGSSGSSSSASYSSSSSAGYGSSSSGGRQGLFARWHAKKAAKHASSGSSASYGSYASSSGSSASYGSYSGSSSSGSSASYGGYAAPSGYYDQGVPVEGGVVEPQPADPAASIRVTLPNDALVFVNDRPTTSTGAERTFVSRGLAGGRTYAYELRVEFTVDGEKVVENKTVRLQAGQSIDLSFGSGEQVATEGPASTDLTLHVPAEATVTLAGAPTKQTGETRTYATTTLASGQEWNGYVVRVELQRDGKTLVEEKTISIVGGKTYELSFDFAGNDAHVASIN